MLAHIHSEGPRIAEELPIARDVSVCTKRGFAPQTQGPTPHPRHAASRARDTQRAHAPRSEDTRHPPRAYPLMASAGLCDGAPRTPIVTSQSRSKAVRKQRGKPLYPPRRGQVVGQRPSAWEQSAGPFVYTRTSLATGIEARTKREESASANRRGSQEKRPQRSIIARAVEVAARRCAPHAQTTPRPRVAHDPKRRMT